MTSPRIEIDLSKIRHNTRSLVGRLKLRGITVTGVTKAVCGHPAIARAMLDGGVSGLAESRISNVQRMRQAGIAASIAMIRTPMPSQLEQIVRSCEISYNTQIDVIAALADVAVQAGLVQNIILMVEMGDMRDGILPEDLGTVAKKVVGMKGVALKGIGTNYACLSGVVPGDCEMTALSALADETEGLCGPFLEVVSGGNSANLPWALGTRATGRVNDLRLGEAILLGVDPVTGEQIDGLHADAFTLVAEVIEEKIKPKPVPVSPGVPALAILRLISDSAAVSRSILAIGKQDTNVQGLSMPQGVSYQGATSDHLVVETFHSALRVGSELKFQMNYSALMQAMAAPDITTTLLKDTYRPTARHPRNKNPHLAIV